MRPISTGSESSKTIKKMIMFKRIQEACGRNKEGMEGKGGSLDLLFFKLWRWLRGKGPVDGVGGTVKTVVYRKVQSGHTVISSAKGFTEYANLVVKKIQILFVPDAEMDVVEPQETPKVPGTLQIQHINQGV